MTNNEGMGRRTATQEVRRQTEEDLRSKAEHEQEFFEDLAEEIKREIPKANVEIRRDGSATFDLSVALWENEIVYVTSNPKTEGKKVGQYTMVWCSEQSAGDELWNSVEKNLKEKQGI